MSVSWTTDRKKPGAPSSMDLLLRWLLKPGNYDRWKSDPKKTPIAEEIAEKMKTQGVGHRTARCVYFKIYNLKRQYKSVKKWLDGEGQLALFHCGEATEIVEATVLRRCPFFRELAPIFDKDDEDIVDSGGEEQDEGDTDDIEQESSDEGNGAKDHDSMEEKPSLKNSQSKRNIISSSHDSSGTRSSKKGKRQSILSKSTVNIPTARIARSQAEADEVNMILGSYRTTGHSFLENGEFGDYHDVKSISLSGNAGEEMAKKLIEFELKRKAALAKLHLDAETKREELRTKLETVLSRYRLKREGVSDEDVSSILPL